MECQATVPDLAALVRNKIGVRRRHRLEQHIDTCEQCALTKQRLEVINTRLRAYPKLPWNIWSTGFTSAIKAQVSSVLGTSAVVSLAGSSALAMAVLVPTPLSIEPMVVPQRQPRPNDHDGAHTRRPARSPQKGDGAPEARAEQPRRRAHDV